MLHPLRQGEDERYSEYPQTEQPLSLMEHCLRAIEKGATIGPHGLPLIGTGDWNDGLNRVGENGQGESVWLAWFLCDVLKRFAAICEQAGDIETAQRLQVAGKRICCRRRADPPGMEPGTGGRTMTMGRRSVPSRTRNARSMQSPNPGLCSAGQATHSAAARPCSRCWNVWCAQQDRLVLLFTPPFDKTPRDPGYIKGYLPGIRENGGQYTHAATWTAWAFASLGDGKQAGALFDLLNPIFQSDTRGKGLHLPR